MRAAGPALAALLALVPAAAVSGQASLHVGGTAALPLGGLADVAEVGYRVLVGGTIDVGEAGAVLGATAFYGRNAHVVSGERSELYGAGVQAGFRLAEAYGARLTAWGGLGGTVHARVSDAFPGLDASRRGLTVSGGATVSRPVGRVGIFVTAFYERGLGDLGTPSYPTELFAIGAGVGIPLGID